MNAGCELFFAGDAKSGIGGKKLDELAPTTKFRCGSIYLVMPLIPSGSTRDLEMLRWRKDPSTIPQAFLIANYNDSRIKNIVPCDPISQVIPVGSEYLPVILVIFGETGITVSMSDDLVGSAEIDYGNVLEVMRSIKVETRAAV
jgi:hypothetical protein